MGGSRGAGSTPRSLPAFSDLGEFVGLTRHLLAPGALAGHEGCAPPAEMAALPAEIQLAVIPPTGCSGASCRTPPHFESRGHEYSPLPTRRAASARRPRRGQSACRCRQGRPRPARRSRSPGQRHHRVGNHQKEALPTVYQLLLGMASWKRSAATEFGFDVLPANRELAGAEVELIEIDAGNSACATPPRRPLALRFRLIDCPPALNMLTVNGLVARRRAHPDAVSTTPWRPLRSGRNPAQGAPTSITARDRGPAAHHVQPQST